VLADVKLRSEILSRTSPFCHLVIAPVITENTTQTLLTEFATYHWKGHREPLYFFEVPDTTDRVRHCYNVLMSDRRFMALSASLALVFKQKSEPIPILDLHKYVSHSGIGFHTDCGVQEVRLIINLNRGWSPIEGGLWALAGSKKNLNRPTYIPPISNSGFCFRPSRYSFHGLTTRRKSNSYAIVCRYPFCL